MNLVVAVDGSAAANRAFDHTLSMLEPLGMTATIVHAVEPQILIEGGKGPAVGAAGTGNHIVAKGFEDAESRAERVLNTAVERAADAGVDVATELLYGDPVEAILIYADEADADGTFVGYRGLSKRYEGLVGNAAKELIERASYPAAVAR